MNKKNELVIVITHGLDDERASVAWSIANGGINSGLEVSVFLASSAVDWARKGAANRPHLNPEDPSMMDMIQNVIENKCAIGVCPPCIKVRGYSEDDIIKEANIIGSGFIHDRIKRGAQVLTF